MWSRSSHKSRRGYITFAQAADGGGAGPPRDPPHRFVFRGQRTQRKCQQLCPHPEAPGAGLRAFLQDVDGSAPKHAGFTPKTITPPLEESFQTENERVPPLRLLQLLNVNDFSSDLIKFKMFPDSLSVPWAPSPQNSDGSASASCLLSLTCVLKVYESEEEYKHVQCALQPPVGSRDGGFRRSGSVRRTLHILASPSLMSHKLFIHTKLSCHNTQTCLYPSIKDDGACWPPAA